MQAVKEKPDKFNYSTVKNFSLSLDPIKNWKDMQ